MRLHLRGFNDDSLRWRISLFLVSLVDFLLSILRWKRFHRHFHDRNWPKLNKSVVWMFNKCWICCSKIVLNWFSNIFSSFLFLYFVVLQWKRILSWFLGVEVSITLVQLSVKRFSCVSLSRRKHLTKLFQSADVMGSKICQQFSTSQRKKLHQKTLRDFQLFPRVKSTCFV